MKPYCSRCYTEDPYPVEADTGEIIYWFKLAEDGDACTIGINEDGEVTDMFVGIMDKEFEYNKEFELMCPDCVAQQAGVDESELFED